MNKYNLLRRISKEYPYTLNFKTNQEDLIAFDPLIKFTGYYDRIVVELLNPAGEATFELIVESFGSSVINVLPNFPDDFKYRNSATVLRDIADLIASKFVIQKFTGLYGAYKYEAAYVFENICDEIYEGEIFTFFLFDSFIDVEKSIVVSPRNSHIKLEDLKNEENLNVSVSNIEIQLNESEYIELVEVVKGHFRAGDVFEIVIRNEFSANYFGDVVSLYEMYAEKVKTPYQFFYDFGNEKLIGCSPELFLKIDRTGKVEIRPISGTVKRSDDVIEDHENLLYLLNSEKEKTELDMLIDLARNDLARFCKAGVTVEGYRKIQILPYVYHTYAVVTGTIEDNIHPLDGVYSCFHAGTLTGAPKVEAMKIINKLEKSNRNYYGGCNGYYRFSGECEFAITIRSLEIDEANEMVVLKAGATLLNESDPKMEYQETLNKMSGFLNLITS